MFTIKYNKTVDGMLRSRVTEIHVTILIIDVTRFKQYNPESFISTDIMKPRSVVATTDILDIIASKL